MGKLLKLIGNIHDSCETTDPSRMPARSADQQCHNCGCTNKDMKQRVNQIRAYLADHPGQNDAESQGLRHEFEDYCRKGQAKGGDPDSGKPRLKRCTCCEVPYWYCSTGCLNKQCGRQFAAENAAQNARIRKARQKKAQKERRRRAAEEKAAEEKKAEEYDFYLYHVPA